MTLNLNHPLLDPDPNAGGGGGGGGVAFLDTLPEDIRKEPSLATFKDPATLAKSYVNAQKLIGTKRLAAPDAAWGDQQWNEFYEATGRPKTAGDYKMPEVKLEDGITLDKDRVTKVQEQLHKLGLSDRQFRGVMEYYLGTINEGAKSQRTAEETARATAEAALKQEFGDKYEANVDLARATIRKFGDDATVKFLEESGVGNRPEVVRMLSKVGKLIAEDTSRGGGADFAVRDSTRAIQEIDAKKTDVEFMKALMTRDHPGHQGAVDLWKRLHGIAYPGKQEE